MKKNKQIFAKRILPVLLTLAMLLGAFPIMGISSSAATTYTKPKAGDLVGMDHTERVREEGDGSRYWLTLDDGVVHNAKGTSCDAIFKLALFRASSFLASCTDFS